MFITPRTYPVIRWSCMGTLSIILLTFFAAGVGTMTGFGTSTIMIPVLSIFLPIPVTILFVGVIHWFGDIWKMVFFNRGINWKLILLFGIPGIVAGFLAAKLPLVLPESFLKRLLGIFLIVYVLFLFKKPSWKIKPHRTSSIIGGILYGLSAGIFGVGGAIRSTFLSAYDLKKSVFLFTSGVIGFLVDSSRLSQYLLSGTRLNPTITRTLILSIPSSFLGAFIAKKFVDKIPQKSFRYFIAIALLVIGVRYILI